MTLGVVVPCYRQERFLPRTLAALERALAPHDWHGVLVQATPGEATVLPALSSRWTVRHPHAQRPTTPGAARNLGLAACSGTWALFVDADIEVEPAWLARALDALAAEPALAGAWGRLEEWFVDAGGERPGARDLNRVGDGDHDCELLAPNQSELAPPLLPKSMVELAPSVSAPSV